VALGAFHDFQHFDEWARLLGIISTQDRGDRFPPFSGYVSIEHEACKEPEMLHNSVEWLAAAGMTSRERGEEQ
jgi:hypothetical protein